MSDIVIVTQGEYSDYSVMGLFRKLKDFSPSEAAADWVKLHPEQTESYRFDNYAFLSYLVQNDYLEQINPPDWKELHLFDYGGYEEKGLEFSKGWSVL